MEQIASEGFQKFTIPNRVAIVAGNGGLPKVVITARASTAEIYLHGAHVTAFQKTGEPPLLFMSGSSLFATGKPIRGGVPICFPWFGPREGHPAHGFARLADWELVEAAEAADGAVSVHLRLPQSAGGADAFPGPVEFTLTAADTLTTELRARNLSGQPVTYEECLHTYFTVGDIDSVSITGLKGVDYLDKVDGGARKRETGDAIRITSEVDRVYLNTMGPVEIHDAKLRRRIRVEKSGSASTVVWNPWVAKSKAMPDFGDEEFPGMVCVESGNVAENKITLAPGATTVLKVTLHSQPL